MSEEAITLNVTFTPTEAQFIIENLSKLNVPLTDPNAVGLASLGRSVIDKINTAGVTAMQAKAAETAAPADSPDVLDLDGKASAASTS
jgi:hypothetical protein